MVGRASPRSLPIRLLTSPHDAIISNRWRSPQANFNTRCDGTKSIGPGRRLAGFRNAGATMPGGLCAGLERSWMGSARVAQACNAASPRPSAGAGANSLVMALIAEHTGDLIVEIDLTRIGPVSRTLPFGSDPPRSAPLRAAALRTAQTMAAEKIDRSRTE